MLYFNGITVVPRSFQAALLLALGPGQLKSIVCTVPCVVDLQSWPCIRLVYQTLA